MAKGIKVGDVVYFEGIDLTSTDQMNWASMEDCAKQEPVKIEGIGFVVAISEETISLALLRAADQEAAFGILGVVPKGCIRTIRRLRVK